MRGGSIGEGRHVGYHISHLYTCVHVLFDRIKQSGND